MQLCMSSCKGVGYVTLFGTLALLPLFRFLQPIQICLWQYFSQSESCYSTLSIKMLLCQSIRATSCLLCLTLWQILFICPFGGQGGWGTALAPTSWRIDLQAMEWDVSRASTWPWPIFQGWTWPLQMGCFCRHAQKRQAVITHPGSFPNRLHRLASLVTPALNSPTLQAWARTKKAQHLLYGMANVCPFISRTHKLITSRENQRGINWQTSMGLCFTPGGFLRCHCCWV